MNVTVYVNDRPVTLSPGMKVKHALLAAGVSRKREDRKKICDEWGNEIGQDGALTEGMKIYVR